MMGISHDLKTPLASVSGYIHAIRDGYADTPEKLAKYTAIIEGKTQLLESRISALIDYIRQDTDEWKTRLQDVALLAFLTEFAGVCEAEATVRHRRFVHELAVSDTLRVSMDPDMILRAMENLAHNAVQYSPHESAVRFAARQDGDTVMLSFSNGGPGIPEDELPHVFDPFTRGRDDRRGGGLGLGLWTVQSIVSSHGWEIDAESEPGVLTVFTVKIPL
jgi:signal transduction histidine kinase